MKKARRGWRGYIFSRPIAGQNIPQRVQNLVLRTYAERQGIRFLLSAVEYRMQGSFMMLESLYDALPELEGLLFYSINMLPETRAARGKLYAAALGRGARLRFALEELEIAGPADVAVIEDVLALRALSPTSLPAGLLS
jgi:sporadic carbohydrate cluster protein (TIGR04323 family)